MGQYLLQAMKKGPTVAGQEGSGGGVTYELYCREDGDRTASSGELQDLAERLSKLESAVGANELRTGVSVVKHSCLAISCTSVLFHGPHPILCKTMSPPIIILTTV